MLQDFYFNSNNTIYVISEKNKADIEINRAEFEQWLKETGKLIYSVPDEECGAVDFPISPAEFWEAHNQSCIIGQLSEFIHHKQNNSTAPMYAEDTTNSFNLF